MEQVGQKPFIWVHFGSDKFGFDAKNKFGARDFLKTNHDFNVVFDDDIKSASDDLLLKICGAWICVREVKYVEILPRMPNVKVISRSADLTAEMYFTDHYIQVVVVVSCRSCCC